MRKKFLIFGALICSSFLLIPAFKEATQVAEAAFVSKKILEDDFSGSTINSDWIIYNDASLKQEYTSFRLTPSMYNWGSSITLNKELSGSFSIEMDILAMTQNGWLAMGLGLANNGAEFSTAKGGAVFFDTHTQYLYLFDNVLKPNDTNYTQTCFAPNLREKRHIKIEVNEIGSTQYMQMTVFSINGTKIGDIFTDPIEYETVNGYFGINSNLKSVEIFNFVVKDGTGTKIYEDDFSSSSVLYPSSGLSTSMWRSNFFDETELKVGRVNTLSLPKIDSGLIYSYPLDLIDNQDMDIVYTFRAGINVSNMDLDTETGIEIGMSTTLYKGYFFGIRKQASGYKLVSFNEPYQEEVVVTASELPADMIVSVTLNIHRNGIVDFSTQEATLQVSGVVYSGLFGFFTRGLHAVSSSSKGGAVTFVVVTQEVYKANSSPDVSNNFNGVKKEWYEVIGTYVYSYYLSRREWNVGSNVRPVDYDSEDEGNGRLDFYQASTTSFFGPKNTYKDFIVRFDVHITSQKSPFGGTIGICFGAKRLGVAYENLQALGIGYYPHPQDKNLYINTPAASNSVKFTETSPQQFLDENGNYIDMFKDQGSFTMLYVVRDNTVELHFVDENEPIENLSIVRAEVKTEEYASTDGLVCIFGANGMNFEIDNFSLVNLDYEAPVTTYFGESGFQETTRFDFTSSDDTYGILLDNASVSRKALSINEDGSISTQNVTKDGIVRLTTKNIEDTLKIDVNPTLFYELINRDSQKSVVINNSGYTQTINLDKDFEFGNATFDFQKFGNRLKVRYVSGDSEFSHIDENVTELTIIDNSSNNRVKLTSFNGFSSLTSFSYFNFDNHLTIKARDFDPEKDVFDPWNEKPVLNTGSGGCSGSVSTQSLLIAVVALGGVAVVSMLKKRKVSE